MVSMAGMFSYPILGEIAWICGECGAYHYTRDANKRMMHSLSG